MRILVLVILSIFTLFPLSCQDDLPIPPNVKNGIVTIPLLAVVESTYIHTLTAEEKLVSNVQIELCQYDNLSFVVAENIPIELQPVIDKRNPKTHAFYYLISEDYKYALACVIPYENVCKTFMWYSGNKMTRIYFPIKK